MKKFLFLLLLFTVSFSGSIVAQKAQPVERNFSFNNFVSKKDFTATNPVKKAKPILRLATGEPKGHVVFCVERFTIGQGYFVAPVIVPFYEGESAVAVLLNVVGADNIDAWNKDDTGSPSFYLSAIKSADTGELNIPQYIFDDCGLEEDWLESNDDDWLGEFDYTFMSGWMYFVNNRAVSYGMGAYEVQDGDVIRVQFTLYGYGTDLGSDFMGSGAPTVANKDELTRTVAQINSAENKAELVAAPSIKVAYDAAYTVLQDMTSTQESTDATNARLEAAVEAFKNPALGVNLPDYDSYWPSFRKDLSNQAIVDTPLATEAGNLVERWKVQLATGFTQATGSPILVNGNLYLASASKIRIIDPVDGRILKEGTLAANTGYFSTIAYGDGMIFVPLSSGIIQAFNAETLESLWQTATISGQQPLCQVTYKDGYLYAGTSNGATGAGSTGYFFCLDARDEDPGQTNEIKAKKWQSPDERGFYWAGATIVGNALVFAGDSGILHSCNRLTGDEIDSYDIRDDETDKTGNKTIRGSISYDAASGVVYFTGKESQKAYKVPVNADGSFNKAAIRTTSLAGQATIAPLVYNNRLYVTSGTMTSSGGLDVIDATTMQLIYHANIGGISQAFPLMTTAYANAANNNTVYVYVTLNANNGNIVCIRDFEGNTSPVIQFSYTPSTKNYCLASLISDEAGSIYYRNDSGYFFAFNSVPTTTGLDEQKSPVSVYPNPFADYMVIHAATAGNAVIYDLSGKAVLNTSLEAGSNRINTSALAKGMYLVKSGAETVKIVK
ncbi:T9SS type A sorting domain-containing protein [Viscerimonas tarda]